MENYNRQIKIFIVEDDLFSGELIRQRLQEEEKFHIEWYKTGRELLENLSSEPNIISLDYNLPECTGLELLEKIKAFKSDIATVVVSGQDDMEVVIEAYDKGADGYIMKNENMMANLVKTIENFASRIHLQKEVEHLRSQIVNREKYGEIVGESGAIMQVMRMIQKVEKSNILTLVTGDSGTGKEVVAHAIHNGSDRKKRPFVAVNMACHPEDLIESELFGHEKGAFTGASSRRIGKFEEANKGTIFLDEIGEMPPALQTKLLRVLQENTVVRLGSNKDIALDIRVIAATNKNLAALVQEGKFREDLFYRLQGFLIELPPLKERDNDIIILANHFIKVISKNNKLSPKTISNQAISMLMEHDWPGNVRELKSVMERALLVCDSNQINTEDIILPKKYTAVKVA